MAVAVVEVGWVGAMGGRAEVAEEEGTVIVMIVMGVSVGQHCTRVSRVGRMYGVRGFM